MSTPIGFTPAQTGLSRVFLIEWRARVDRVPTYQSCLKMEGIDWSLGDIEKIQCPDPNNYNQFIEVGQIQGASDRPSTSLVGHYALDLRSTLLRLARIGCPLDVQLHMGACTHPANFNQFSKAIILEDVLLSSYGTDPLGAIGEDEKDKVDETVDISFSDLYEVVPLDYIERAGDVVTNEIIDMTRCDVMSCGECGDLSDGCSRFYGLTLTAGGSPGTPADVIFSLDKGTTWAAHDVDTATGSPNALACVDDYVVVVSNFDGGHHYALKSEFDSGVDPVFTQQLLGYVGDPNDIWSLGPFAFVVGEGGYIYAMADPVDAVTVLDAGVANVEDYNAVHAISELVAVAVGDDGAVAYTLDGTGWQAPPTRPVGLGVDLQCVWVMSEDYWWVGTDAGDLYYTIDRGVTWVNKGFPGSGAGWVWDIQFPTPSVGFMAHATAGPAGRILRTFDGGYSWTIAPVGAGTFPANDRIRAIATCPEDANIVVGGGLADLTADGIVVVGRD